MGYGRYKLGLHPVEFLKVGDVLHHGDLAHAWDGSHAGIQRAFVGQVDLCLGGLSRQRGTVEYIDQHLIIHDVRKSLADDIVRQPEHTACGQVGQDHLAGVCIIDQQDCVRCVGQNCFQLPPLRVQLLVRLD